MRYWISHSLVLFLGVFVGALTMKFYFISLEDNIKNEISHNVGDLKNSIEALSNSIVMNRHEVVHNENRDIDQLAISSEIEDAIGRNLSVFLAALQKTKSNEKEPEVISLVEPEKINVAEKTVETVSGLSQIEKELASIVRTDAPSEWHAEEPELEPPFPEQIYNYEEVLLKIDSLPEDQEFDLIKFLESEDYGRLHLTDANKLLDEISERIDEGIIKSRF